MRYDTDPRTVHHISQPKKADVIFQSRVADEHIVFQVKAADRLFSDAQLDGQSADAVFSGEECCFDPVDLTDLLRIFGFKIIALAADRFNPGIVGLKFMVDGDNVTPDRTRGGIQYRGQILAGDHAAAALDRMKEFALA